MRELQNRYENLTPREREVLAHVVSGKLNKQIAFDLGAAERTIKAHRASIMDKLGVQSVAELVRLAQELGIDRFVDMKVSGVGFQIAEYRVSGVEGKRAAMIHPSSLDPPPLAPRHSPLPTAPKVNAPKCNIQAHRLFDRRLFLTNFDSMRLARLMIISRVSGLFSTFF